MKNKLLAAMALTCATSMSAWAGNWEKPALSFVDPDLTVPTEEIPTTGYKYIRDLGNYYIYHVASGMFLGPEGTTSTSMVVSAPGQLCTLGYGYDRVLYNADTYAHKGWLISMPNAKSNSADGGRYHELWIKGQQEGWIDGNGGHMLWQIVRQEDGTYRISVIDDDPEFGSASEWAGGFLARIPTSAEDETTKTVIPLANPDAGFEFAQMDWKFVTEDAYAVYQERFPLYDALNKAEEGGMAGLDEYVAVYNNADATVEELKKAAEDLKVAFRNFQLADLIEGASPTNPKDLTSVFANTDGTSLDGWTREGKVAVQNNGQHWSNPGSTAPVEPNLYFEPCDWGATGWQASLTQTLDMPNGMYKLTAAGRASAGVKISLIANELKVDFPSIGATGGTIDVDGKEWESFEAGTAEGAVFGNDGNGHGWNYRSISFTVTDGKVTIGCEASTSGQHEWASVDDFKLLYMGEVTSDVVREQLENAIKNAQDKKAEMDLMGSIYSIAGEEAYDADLKAAEDMLADEAASEMEVLEMVTKLEDRLAALQNDVKVYSQMEAKFAELDAIAERAPGVDLNKFNDYYDALYDAVGDRTFDPADYDGITAKAEELFREDFFEAVKAGDISDITPLIINPDFSNGATGWNGGPAIGNGVGEKYNTVFDVYQELTGLPAGSYEISVQGFYRPGGYADCATNYGVEGNTFNEICSFIYGNDSQKPMLHLFTGLYEEQPSTGRFVALSCPNDMNVDGRYVADDLASANYAINTGGNYMPTEESNRVVCAVGEDGVLRFGVKATSHNNGANWTAFDNFKITYLGSENMDGYKAALQTALTAAEAVYNTTDVMATDDATALRNLKATTEIAMDGYTTAEQFVSATAQLQEAMALVQEGIALIKEVYNQANLYMEAYENGLYDKYDKDLAYEFLDACEMVIYTYEDNAFATLADVKELQNEMNLAYANMIMGNLTGSDENRADVTDLIMCPSFEDLSGALSSTGWTTGGKGALKEAAGGYNFEVYDTPEFDINQKLYSLKAGWYVLEVQGFYRAGGDGINPSAIARHDSIDARNAYLYATTSEGKTVERELKSIYEGVLACTSIEPLPGYYSNDVMIPTEYLVEGVDDMDLPNYVPNMPEGGATRFEAGYYKNQIAFEVTENMEYVQIGVKKDVELTKDWAIFDNFKLYYTGNDKPTVSVENVEAATAGVVKSTYYTIGGVRISKPAQSGLYIREDLLSDGSKKVTKIMVK